MYEKKKRAVKKTALQRDIALDKLNREKAKARAEAKPRVRPYAEPGSWQDAKNKFNDLSFFSKIGSIGLVVVYCYAWPVHLIPNFFAMFEGKPIFEFSLMTYLLQVLPLFLIPILPVGMLINRFKERVPDIWRKSFQIGASVYGGLLLVVWFVSYFLICSHLESNGYIECVLGRGRSATHSYVLKSYAREAIKEYGHELRFY